jgi:hypothetical protein
MPNLHRYLGTPVLSFIGRCLYGNKIGDYNCGMRGFRTQSMKNLDLKCSGMEFASEMIIKSSLAGYKMTEIPTTLSKDKRNRPPFLNTWKDGYRHLRILVRMRFGFES